ncbi:hypothetical protein BU17DRAFT_89974 [Hysterangium stoloniferum]|nr:hypothetical protein BU17DRAFT_89974 [Hysterangium stoloniferum]
MPSSTVVHAAVFAVGAVIGAGTAVAITRRRQEQLPSSVPVSLTSTVSPGVELQRTGHSSALQAKEFPGSVLKYGHPGPISDLLTRKVYVAGYDRRLRHPSWTAEHLTRAMLGQSALEPVTATETGDRSKSTFEEDKDIPTFFRARLADYFKSGYDRGHMVPAADAKISQEAMDETFLLSNIAPQVGNGFNRHYWAYLERWCRDLTQSFSDVYVFTIPLYLPKLDTDGKSRVTYEVIGNPPNVAVPTHFAKVVLTTRPVSPSTPHISEVSAGAFVLPNAPIPHDAPLKGFIVPVDAVEKAAGLQIFPEEVKVGARHICQTTNCQLVVRRFDDAQKMGGKDTQKAIAAPGTR